MAPVKGARTQRALEVFTKRSLAQEDYVALWMDAAFFQGTPFVFCMGATTIEGAMGFTESTLNNRGALERMLQHLIELGTGPRGLGCVMSGGSTRPCRSTLGRL